MKRRFSREGTWTQQLSQIVQATVVVPLLQGISASLARKEK